MPTCVGFSTLESIELWKKRGCGRRCYLDLVESQAVFLGELIDLFAFSSLPIDTVREGFQGERGSWTEGCSFSPEKSCIVRKR